MTVLKKYVDYTESALQEIKDDSSNSIQEAISNASDKLSDILIERWINNDSEKAGDLLFTLLDDLLELKSQEISDNAL